jgi:hypothetical protein
MRRLPEEASAESRLGRAASVSDATEELLDRFRRESEPVTELDPGEHVPVPTTLALPTQVDAVRSALL